jgi:hypothetical protein
MWTCALCQHAANPDTAAVCANCFLRRGAARVNTNSLCVLHSTTEKAFVGIRTEGFKLTEKFSAGRSIGDVVYGYVYMAAEDAFHGSVTHAVNVCWTEMEKRFAIFQIAFDFPLDKVMVVDQPRWSDLREREKLSNYEAFKRVCGEMVALMARRVKRKQVMAKAKQDEVEVNEALFESITLDHIAEAAKLLGARACYALGTNVITFFYAEDLQANTFWFGADAPASGNSPETAELLQNAEMIAQVQYEQWLGSAGPSTGSVDALSNTTESAFPITEVETNCKKEMKEEEDAGPSEPHRCDACGKEGITLVFYCGTCNNAVWSCGAHLKDLTDIRDHRGTCGNH